MCDSRSEKFIVPVRPAAGMGWWLGQVLNIRGRFYEINVLWVENPEYADNNMICSTVEYIEEFETIVEATDRLKSRGTLLPSLAK